MSLLKSVGHIILFYFVWIVATDIAGVLLVSILPEPDSHTLSGHAGYGSMALYYTVWLVAGCFAGAAFTIHCIEKTKKNQLVQQKPLLIFIIALLLSAALILIFYLVGEMEVPDLDYSSDYSYVPGNRYMTFTFFISFLLITLLLLKADKHSYLFRKNAQDQKRK
ncbi:MAG: hypothetical protein JSS70_09480 [Bacteroidetes bacterium]|nr:hypothetical protein [Bacteroidota bacterium]